MSFLVPMGSLMTGCSCVGRGCRATRRQRQECRLIDVGDEWGDSPGLILLIPVGIRQCPPLHPRAASLSFAIISKTTFCLAPFSSLMHGANASKRTTALKKKKKKWPCNSKNITSKIYIYIQKGLGKTIPGKEISNLSGPTLPVPIRTKNIS